MPISPADLAAILNPPAAPDVVDDADEASYALIPPFVDDQLPTTTRDASGAYPVVIPASMAAVLLTHPSLVASLSAAYSDVGWRVTVAQAQVDGSFALTLLPPSGRSGPVAF